MERTYTLQDLLAALRRRRLLALVVTGAVLVVGVALALGVPSEYSAVSVVQIEPRRLAYDFFPAQRDAVRGPHADHQARHPRAAGARGR